MYNLPFCVLAVAVVQVNERFYCASDLFIWLQWSSLEVREEAVGTYLQ